MNAFVNYWKDSIHELELVRWPTRQQAIRLSAIVLGFTIVNSLVFGLVDQIFTTLLHFFLSSIF